MNAYTKVRADRIKEILLSTTEPGSVHSADQLTADLLEYLEKEISAAFGRGFREAKKPGAGIDRKVDATPSALQAGKLKPAVADVEEIQQ